MAIRFDHLGILSATDEENASIAAFFRDVLGLEVDGDGGYAEVKAGVMTIALHRGALADDGVSPHGGTLLQFSTDDVRAEVDTIRARGGRITLEPVDTDWGTTRRTSPARTTCWSSCTSGVPRRAASRG